VLAASLGNLEGEEMSADGWLLLLRLLVNKLVGVCFLVLDSRLATAATSRLGR
jgi:hypothetical protein